MRRGRGKRDRRRCPAGLYAIRRFTGVAKGMAIHKYCSSACPRRAPRSKCTTYDHRRLSRWGHAAVLDALREQLDADPQAMQRRHSTVEHPLGTIKAWMGATHFLCRRLPRVNAEISLHVLAYKQPTPSPSRTRVIAHPRPEADVHSGSTSGPPESRRPQLFPLPGDGRTRPSCTPVLPCQSARSRHLHVRLPGNDRALAAGTPRGLRRCPQ